MVVVRDSMSTSPDWSCGKRVLAVLVMNLTDLGSPKIPAATARQTSTSKPCHSP